jgi:hypothetical protein
VHTAPKRREATCISRVCPRRERERSLESALESSDRVESDFAFIRPAEHGRRRIARSSPIAIGSALSNLAGALPYRVSYRSANRRFLPATTGSVDDGRRHAPPPLPLPAAAENRRSRVEIAFAAGLSAPRG